MTSILSKSARSHPHPTGRQFLKVAYSLIFAIFPILFPEFAPSAEAKEMTFDVIYNNHTNIIVADGNIVPDTPKRFQEFLDSDRLDGFRFIVHLNSDGGSLYGGIQLGRMIRANGFATGIQSYQPRAAGAGSWWPAAEPGLCMSACALAFLGGENRAIDSASHIGFHQFSSSRASSDAQSNTFKTEATTQLVSSDVLDYIVSMGASVELFMRMSHALPNEMFIPGGDDLLALKIVSQTAFRDFGFEPYRSGVIAYSTFPENVEGRSVVHQITTYCKGGRPFVLLSGAPGSRGLSDSWIEASQEYLNGFTIWPAKPGPQASYPARNVRFRAGSSVLAEIQIDTSGAEALARNGQARIDIPAVSGFIFSFRIQASEMDSRKIKSSFTHCIS